jgi:phosphatidylglycerol lysyltransferase
MRWHRLLPLIGLAAFVAALAVLHHTLSQYRYRELAEDLRAIPGRGLLLAALLTLVDYLVLTAYDAFSLRALGRRLAYPKVAATAFIAYAFSHNLGYAAISGGSIRWRFYSAWGLAPAEIAGVTILGVIAFWVGFITIGGAVFCAWPPSEDWHLPIDPRLLGALALGLVGGLVALALARPRPIRIGAWTVPPPPRGSVLALACVACVDWVLVAGVVWSLLPTGDLSFAHFVGCFILAQAAGVASQVPGGLGVVEASLLVMLGDELPKPALAGALLAYRAIYYLAPFGAAVALLSTLEALRHRMRLGRAFAAVGRATRPLVPHLFAAAAFGAGAVLLLSGATPGIEDRLHRLGRWLPLAVVEASHLLASLCGMGLLLLARGLQLRVREAYVGAWALLWIGAAFSLLKGIDYEEAIVLLVVAGAMVPFRSYFTRRSSLAMPRFTLRWVAAIATVLLCSLWLTAFCYRHVGYQHEPWWQLALDAQAPRSLRGELGAAVLLFAFALWRLLRPAMPRIRPAAPEEVARAQTALARSGDALGNLALTGDKALLFDERGEGFLMYAPSGRCLVAMSDPIGAPAVREELAWRFLARCRDLGACPVFYQVHRDQLPLYLDLGLALLKLGEEARVDLKAFSLKTARKDLRRSHARALKEGCSFAVLAPEEIPPLLPRLRAISDGWLAEKGAAEKGFSLGFFDEAYLARLPLAVVRREGQVVAFANLWPTGTREELSFDLMRSAPEASRGVMDLLLVELMQWGQAQGYHWFNLGMAPMSGFRDRPHAPLWSRAAAQLFRHGEAFYNFRGLREYKDKFGPQWQPRYLACPGGLAVPRVLAQVSLLIGGGLRGMLPVRTPHMRAATGGYGPP